MAKVKTKYKELSPEEQSDYDADQALISDAVWRMDRRLDKRTSKQRQAAARKAAERKWKSYKDLYRNWTDGSRVSELMQIWSYCKEEDIEMPREAAEELLDFWMRQELARRKLIAKEQVA